jgi:hypothetical protein
MSEKSNKKTVLVFFLLYFLSSCIYFYTTQNEAQSNTMLMVLNAMAFPVTMAANYLLSLRIAADLLGVIISAFLTVLDLVYLYALSSLIISLSDKLRGNKHG